MSHPHENVGQHFSRENLLKARDRSVHAVTAIAKKMTVGIREAEAKTMGKQTLIELGMEKEWHPTLIRIGKNTLNTFKQASDPTVILQPNDIFFIDIGPVFHGHEGDAGATFTVGNDPDMIACAKAAEILFHAVKQKWQTEKLTGKALYAYAEKTAHEMGWELNLSTPGHRVGDFPHAIHQADRLARIDFTPAPDLWILEIQIRHPTRPFGAFYEDILGT